MLSHMYVSRKQQPALLLEFRAGEREVAVKGLEMRRKNEFGVELWELCVCLLSCSVRASLGLHVVS